MPVEIPDFRIAIRRGAVRLEEWQPWLAGGGPLCGSDLPRWGVEARPDEDRGSRVRSGGVGATEGA